MQINLLQSFPMQENNQIAHGQLSLYAIRVNYKHLPHTMQGDTYKIVHLQTLEYREHKNLHKAHDFTRQSLFSESGSKTLLTYEQTCNANTRAIFGNGFFSAFLQAYNNHGDVKISPDDVWIVIMLYFSKYVNDHSKQLRNAFVSHEGQKKLVVVTKNQLSESQWDEFFTLMIEAIKDNTTKGVTEKFESNFTTTGRVQKLLSIATIMNTYEKYFSYGRIWPSLFRMRIRNLLLPTNLSAMSDRLFIQINLYTLPSMSSGKYGNFMTAARHQAEERSRKKYSNMKQQRNMTFYNLYKDKIVTIQRWFRTCLARKTAALQKKIMIQMKKRQELLGMNEEKMQVLRETSDRRAILMEQREGEFIAYLEEQIKQKIMRALAGTLSCADQLASSTSKAQYALSELKQYTQRGEELQGQVEALHFQYTCHRKRKAEWQEKLFQIKQNILNETLKTKDIKNRLNHFNRHPLQPPRQPTAQ